MKVDGDFEVEHEKILLNTKSGLVKISYLFNARLEEKGLELPATFCFLLVNRETREEAERLLCEALNLNLMPFAIHTLCNIAYKKGFGEAWKLLEEFRREKPKPGKFRFYIGTLNPTYVSQDASLPQRVGVDVTDGEKFYRVDFNFTLEETPSLPVNVYAEAINTPLRLEYPEDFKKLLKKNPETTFQLVEKLTKMDKEQEEFSRSLITRNRLQEIFNSYLKDEGKGFKLLREAEKDFKHKVEREKIWRSLWEKAPVEVNGLGYIVPAGDKYIPQHPEYLYFVTSDGMVYLLASRWATADTRENVFRFMKSGRLPESLREVEDSEVLREVARKLAPLNPALVNVIIP
jgi:hypothetical protein